MIVRELIAMFGFQVDKKSETSVESSVQGIIKGAKLLGTALVAGAITKGIFDLVEGTAEMADNLGATAQKLGVGAQALQALHFAGKLANVSNEELNTGLRTLAKNAFEAGTGNKEAGESFKRLGVNVRGANGQLKPVDTLMTELGDRFKNLGSDTERVAVAQKLFGRSGAALLPLLTQGSAAIAAQRKELEDLGGVIDDELIEQGDRFTDNQDKMRTAVQGLKNVVAKALLPVFNESVEATLEWFKANREIIRQNLVAFLEKAIAAFGRIKRFIVDVIDTVFEWVRSLSPVQSALLKVAAVAAGLALLLALPGGALILLGILVGLLIDDFQTWREGGKSVIGDLIGSLDELQMQFPTLSAVVQTIGATFGTVLQGMQDTLFSWIQFFIDIFTVGPVKAVENFANNTLMIIGDLFGVDLVGAVHGFINEAGAAIAGFWRSIVAGAKAVGSAVLEALKFAFENSPIGLALKGSKALAGAVSGLFGGEAAAAPTAAGRPGVGGASSEQTNNIDISVNAQGQTNDEVGLAIGRQVELVLERQNRDAMGALTTAAPAL